jgi:hypothetical protein
MSLFDFFFPDRSRVARLRDLEEHRRRVDRMKRYQRRVERSGKATVEELQQQLEALRGDVGYVTLLLGALVDQLDAKGTLTREDLRAAAEAIDAVDDVKDGKLDIEALKHAVGDDGAAPADS